MEENRVHEYDQYIDETSGLDASLSELWQTLDGQSEIYAWNAHTRNGLRRVKVFVSEEPRFNTLPLVQAQADIHRALEGQANKHGVYGYCNPSLDVLIEVLDPLVLKLAKQHDGHWDAYTYEDLCQMCRLVIVRLYRKGYYIHKHLIASAFAHEVTSGVRHERNRPFIVSFEDTVRTQDDKSVRIADAIADDDDLSEEELQHARLLIFEEIRQAIIQRFGQRVYDTLLFEYANKSTTNYGRHMLVNVRNYLNRIGLSRDNMYNKYL